MGAAAEHRYEYCTDEHCPRFPCQVYRQGTEDGRRRGFDEGYAQGFEDGYKQGFREGLDACPRPHGKG
jgi:hypothetical protein